MGRVIKDFPVGLLEEMDFNSLVDEPIDYENLSDDQIDGLWYAISQLKSEKQRRILIYRFKDKMLFSEIAELVGCNSSYAGEMAQGGIFHLSINKDAIRYISRGYTVHKKFLEQEKALTVGNVWAEFVETHPDGLATKITDIEWPRYTGVKLVNAGIETLAELREIVQTEGWYKQIPNTSAQCAQRILCKLLNIGVIDDNCPGMTINQKGVDPIRRRTFLCLHCHHYFGMYIVTIPRYCPKCRSYSLVHVKEAEHYRRCEEAIRRHCSLEDLPLEIEKIVDIF